MGTAHGNRGLFNQLFSESVSIIIKIKEDANIEVITRVQGGAS